MPKTLITEATIRDLVSRGVKTLEVPKGAVVTTLAAEVASANGIAFKLPESGKTGTVPKEGSAPGKAPAPAPGKGPAPASGQSPGQVVAFGSDHGGFQLKEMLKKHVESLGYKILDLGTTNEEPCDYPDFAYAVAAAVTTGKAWRGVMIDGAGIGSCVAANKVPGIRAACCHNEFVARNAREHNDTNVLTLGSRVVGSEVCKAIVTTWLETWFSGGRHKQRVDKISDLETRFTK